MSVKAYKKIPVEIKAMQFTRETYKELKEWMGSNLGDLWIPKCINGVVAEVQILTLEDGNFLKAKHIATEGDYIIQGVEGEFYACKPSVFKATYEEIVYGS